MGSIDEKIDLEAHEELTFSSSAATGALHFETVHLHSRADVAYSWISKNVGRIRTPRSLYVVLLNAKITMLLPFGPLAIWLHIVTEKQGWVLFFSLLGMAPLTERLGYVTGQLALHTEPRVGGLINVTFVTVPEIFSSLFALRKGMIRVVQRSLLGSILLNILLVIGWAFFTGGIIHCKKVQVFNEQHALVNITLLPMALMGIMLPAVLHFTHSEAHFGKWELSLSRFSSCVMLEAYASFLFFKFTSHHDCHSPIHEDEDEEGVQDQDSSPEITANEAIGWLSILALWMYILSSYLVEAIQDLTLGVAIGLSTQTSMFTIPFCVIVGWIIGNPMDLNFQLFETVILVMAVLAVAFMLQEGTSNYFKGLMLILCYLIVAASFFVHVDP